MKVLGIETSCDETAAAVVADGERIRSSVVSSQTDIHHPYGGVVPELASRRHLEMIVPVVAEALARSELEPADIDGVAVTQGPGLVGALLVGFSFAKAWASARKLPWVGVDHLEGHIHSVFLEPDPPPFPFVALLASGGHTSLYHVEGHDRMTHMGGTRDDAAGEAFDKVAKMLGLGYPGGAIIGKTALEGEPDRIRFPRARLPGFDFSFSGLKTAVNRHLRDHPARWAEEIPDIAAGFQEAVVDVLTEKLLAAASEKGCDRLAVVGGVAANARLRESVGRAAAEKGVAVHIPAISLCGDNAAMIAAAGFHRLSAGQRSPLAADVYSRAPIR